MYLKVFVFVFQAKKDEKEDSTSIQMVKMEITDEGKYGIV